jgi:hypothetical protein
MQSLMLLQGNFFYAKQQFINTKLREKYWLISLLSVSGLNVLKFFIQDMN